MALLRRDPYGYERTAHTVARARAVSDRVCTQLHHFPVPEILIGSLRNWASSVTLWNLALNPAGGPVQQPNSGCPGCTGLVTINQRTHRVRFSTAYYQLGQVSRLCNPEHGAWRRPASSATTAGSLRSMG